MDQAAIDYVLAVRVSRVSSIIMTHAVGVGAAIAVALRAPVVVAAVLAAVVTTLSRLFLG
jgi:hypothetical protein